MHSTPSPVGIIRELREKLQRMKPSPREGTTSRPHEIDFDNIIDGKILRPGTLVEWLSGGSGGGAFTLVLSVAARMIQDRGVLVVVDGQQEFYPPAAAARGIDLKRLVIVRPPRAADSLWALEQALRCPGVSAALGSLGPVPDHALRRLQLAAETGGSIGLLLRPATALRQASWADLRLGVMPLPAPATARGRCLRVELVRCRHSLRQGVVDLEINDETGAVCLASELADPATAKPA